MGEYVCRKCGSTRSETPFCHGPMANLQADALCAARKEVKRLKDVIQRANEQYKQLQREKAKQDAEIEGHKQLVSKTEHYCKLLNEQINELEDRLAGLDRPERKVV